MARASGVRGARVADEDKLRVEVQRPDREARLQALERHRAHAALDPFGPRERRDALGRLAGRRIDRDRRAPGVVAVEAQAGVQVELRAA